METLCNLILEIYRAAKETPVNEFQDFALALVKAQIPFRSALWGGGELKSGDRLVPRSIHLHNEPPEMLTEWASCNYNSTTVIDVIVANPGRAFVYNTPRLFNSPKDAAIVDYAKRYGHINNMSIYTLSKNQLHGQQWLSLYRADKYSHFSQTDGRTLELIFPHLAEALEFNRMLGGVLSADMSRATKCARAIVRTDGTLYYSGKGFSDFMQRIWPDWESGRLPDELMAAITPDQEVMPVNYAISISTSSLGDMLLLNLRRVSSLRRLSPRELEVATRYGQGLSYKEIAQSLNISPATVRTLTERIYTKLRINNKIDLIALLSEEQD